MKKFLLCLIFAIFFMANAQDYSPDSEKSRSSSYLKGQNIQSGLGHDFILYSNYRGNTGSIESIWGKNIDGTIKKQYHIAEPHAGNPNVLGEFKAYIIEKGDLNGDGMDDIIQVYHTGADLNNDGFGDASIMVVYDGNSGDTLFTKSYIYPGYATYLVQTGDFNNDGKDEIVHVRHSSMDITGDNIADGSFIEIFAYDEHTTPKYNIIGSYTGEFYGTLVSHTDGIKYMDIGDINGDGYDDIGLIHHTEYNGIQYTKSVLRCMDIHNHTLLFEKQLGTYKNKGYMVKFGQFDDNTKTKELLHIRYSGNDDYDNDGNNDNSDIQIFNKIGNPIWFYTGWHPKYSIPGKFQIGINAIITELQIGDINGDGVDDVALIHRQFLDNNVSNPKYIVKTLDIYNDQAIYQVEPSSTNTCYFLRLCNQDSNKRNKEVTFVEKGLLVSYLKVINSNGSNLSQHLFGLTTILELQSGKLLGDDNELLIVAFTAIYNTNQTFVKIIDVINNTTIYSELETSIYQMNDSKFNKLIVLKNEITDEELLKAIDYPFDSVQQLVKYYRDSLRNADAFYRSNNRRNFYNDPSNAYNLKSSINNYSWISYKDKFFDQGTWTTNVYSGAFSRLPLRLDRLYRQLLYNLKEVAGTDEDIILLLKSLMGINRFLQDDRYYNVYTTDEKSNHGLLFYNRQIVFTLPLLHHFKELNKWELNSVQKLKKQIDDHILNDGMHAEHAFSYGFIWMYTFLEVLEMIEINPYNVFSDTISFSKKIRDNMYKMYSNYYLYAIKPLQTIKIGSNNYQTDIPTYGDTQSPAGQWIGKTNSNYSSIFNTPLNFPTDNPLINSSSKFYYLLRFATGLTGGLPPSQTSIYKPNGGEFISRSNWKNENGAFDYNARHAIFKFSDFDYSVTLKTHRHADLLSVELSGYNKNYIIDPLGYEAHTSNSPINREKYYTLYKHYNKTNDTFDLTRNYFIGTAVHNTVYINNKSQLSPKFNDGEYHTFWFQDIDSIHIKEQTDNVIINNSYDYARAGYYKDNGIKEKHERTYVYVKPDTNLDDYWVIVDDITFGKTANLTVPTEQTWHIAPYVQGNGDISLNNSNKIATINNRFKIIPLKTQNLNVELIDTYYCPLQEFVASKTVKYKLSVQTNSFGQYLTIIYPDPTNKLSNVSISKVLIYQHEAGNENLSLVSNQDAIAYQLNYTVSGIRYREYGCIAKDITKQYYWDINRTGIIDCKNTDNIDIERRLEYVPFGQHFCLLKFKANETPIPLTKIGYELNDDNPSIVIKGQNYNNRNESFGNKNNGDAYAFSLSEASDVKFSLCNFSNFDAKIEIRDKSNHVLNLKAFNDNASEKIIQKMPAGIYYVIVDGNNGEQGDYELAISLHGDKVSKSMVIGENIFNDNINASVSIYPNPSKGIINIEINSQELEQIELIDIHGNTLKTFKSRSKIDISDFENGLYILRINTKFEVFYSKIILHK